MVYNIFHHQYKNDIRENYSKPTNEIEKIHKIKWVNDLYRPGVKIGENFVNHIPR
jgi:hypothetical protein